MEKILIIPFQKPGDASIQDGTSIRINTVRRNQLDKVLTMSTSYIKSEYLLTLHCTVVEAVAWRDFFRMRGF